MPPDIEPRTARERVLRLAGSRLLHELTRPFAPLPGDTVLVAVSGGADSVALLHLLAALAPGRGWRLAVGTLDHGLRGDEGAADRAFVESLARRLGLDCVADRRPVDRPAGRSPEDAARRLRRGFLREAAAEVGAGRIALAHTADDQAETTLMRLARGAGLAGLGGIKRDAPPFWRPLLLVRRAALRRLLDDLGETWREDASNEERDAARNRVRLDVLPALERSLGPGVVPALVRAAGIARADEALLASLAADRAQSVTTRTGHGRVDLDRRALLALPEPLARRIVKSALGRVVRGERLLARHVFAVLALARAEGAGTRVDLPENAFAERRGGRIVIRNTDADRREPDSA